MTAQQRHRYLWNGGHGTGDMWDVSPQYLRRGDIHSNVPQYFRSDVVQDVDSSDSNCCLLYFNANIMCSFTKKASASGGLHGPQTPYRGSAPGTHWGPQTPSLLIIYYVPPIIL